MKLLAVIALLALTACGGGSSSDDTGSVFNLWEHTESGSLVDLRGFSLSELGVIQLTSNSITCTCDIQFIGHRDDGSMAISACTADYYADNQYCRDTHEGITTYSVIDSALTLSYQGSMSYWHLK